MPSASSEVPDIDQGGAVSGLRGQLCELATAEGSTPDWSTLRIADG
jgi:hypothetical protein